MKLEGVWPLVGTLDHCRWTPASKHPLLLCLPQAVGGTFYRDLGRVPSVAQLQLPSMVTLPVTELALPTLPRSLLAALFYLLERSLASSCREAICTQPVFSVCFLGDPRLRQRIQEHRPRQRNEILDFWTYSFIKLTCPKQYVKGWAIKNFKHKKYFTFYGGCRIEIEFHPEEKGIPSFRNLVMHFKNWMMEDKKRYNHFILKCQYLFLARSYIHGNYLNLGWEILGAS